MCLNRRAASSPHQRQSLSVQRQLDSALLPLPHVVSIQDESALVALRRIEQ